MGHNEKRTLANLPPGERILVDSNILTYHLLDYPIFGPICEKFLQDILDKKYHGFITSIIASETLFNFIKAYILKTYGAKGSDVPILLKRDPKILQEIPFDRPPEYLAYLISSPTGHWRWNYLSNTYQDMLC